jgi:hypothetical protein
MKGVLRVPDEGYLMDGILRVPDEGDSRKASCALNLISTFSLMFMYINYLTNEQSTDLIT